MWIKLKDGELINLHYAENIVTEYIGPDYAEPYELGYNVKDRYYHERFKAEFDMNKRLDRIINAIRDKKSFLHE